MVGTGQGRVHVRLPMMNPVDVGLAQRQLSSDRSCFAYIQAF